jgi:hypothetical protein
MPQQNKKKEETESTAESASRLGRFAGSTQTKEAKSDPVANIQKFAREEQERQRKKKEEEAAKKKAGVSTEPEKGFLQRMYEKYIGGSK